MDIKDLLEMGEVIEWLIENQDDYKLVKKYHTESSRGQYCPVCGGDLIGDGYTMVYHCENVDVPLGVEPDDDPIFCSEEESGY